MATKPPDPTDSEDSDLEKAIKAAEKEIARENTLDAEEERERKALSAEVDRIKAESGDPLFLHRQSQSITQTSLSEQAKNKDTAKEQPKDRETPKP